MPRSTAITRRAVLASAAALPMAAATAPAARAAAPMMGTGTTRFNRVRLGGFEVTTLLAATSSRADPQSIFGLNVSAKGIQRRLRRRQPAQRRGAVLLYPHGGQYRRGAHPF